MLQQTQVATATPYWRRFVERFPTVTDLARARPASVLAAWAGLGYYRRARFLHEAARVVVRDHGGAVPDDPDVFAALPGVGRYTVGAVMSIAFGRPLPVLDGNVGRVLARLLALDVNAKTPAGAKRLWAIAAAWMPARGASEWNQALMELGATVCTPANPRCDACSVRGACRAHTLGRAAEFPPVAPRAATRHVRRAVALIEQGGALLMARLAGGRLDGLWEPPAADVAPGEPPVDALARVLGGYGVRCTLTPLALTVRHRITRHAITAELWRATLAAPPPRRAGVRWVDPARPAVAVTALARRAAVALARSRRG